jgi:hypothetical protein
MTMQFPLWEKFANITGTVLMLLRSSLIFHVYDPLLWFCSYTMFNNTKIYSVTAYVSIFYEIFIGKHPFS